MDFFEQQDKARRNTRWLAIYFAAGVAFLVLAIYAAVLVIYSWAIAPGTEVEGVRAAPALWNPRLFTGVAIGTLSVVFLGSLFKTMELSRGGSAVATMLGGRLVSPNTEDPDERRLLNVVEEMALASGVPVPQVYVLDNERGINAFAAGHSTSDAAIGVTRGCVQLLNRDELQGVIAHEFSHILNGDMRLNLRLMGLIFGILCIAVIGRILLRTGSRTYRLGARNRGGNPLPLLGLALLLIGYVGVFFGRLIQAAVSRQREFLADASAVQFTRNPGGIAGALKKIGGLVYGSRLESAHAEEASHMFFGNGLSNAWFSLMATHPPLVERIRAIDPAFDGRFPRVSAAEVKEPPAKESAAPRSPFPLPFPFPETRRFESGAGAVANVTAAVVAVPAVMPSLGTPDPAHLRYAVELRNSFTPEIQAAAHDPLGAAALIYAMLLSPDEELRRQQLDLIARTASAAVGRETERLLPALATLATPARLPLVDLALPALRNLSPSQYRQFSEALKRVIESDNQIDLFEYVLQKVTLRHLDPHFSGARKPVVQFYSLRALAPDCSVLLSAMARAGHEDEASAAKAFRDGAVQLSYQAQTALVFLPENQCQLSDVDAALNRLSQAVPQVKRNVLNACAHTVASDGLIQEMEAELLRAVADTLDCPIPPFLQRSGQAA